MERKQIGLPKYQIMNLKERAGKRSPKFFRKLQHLAIVCTAISAAILTAPVALPAALVTASGYLATAAAVAAALSKLTVEGE
jgi:hypothetical protein